jgi:hypothetical protein
MLKIMVRPRQAPCSLLGVGTYYVSAGHNTALAAHRWQILELKNPLMLDRQHAQALFRRLEADSPDPKRAAAGAWALRREITAQGHDAIVAVEGIGDERHLTIAHFDEASAARSTATVIDFRSRRRGPVPAGARDAAALPRAG